MILAIANIKGGVGKTTTAIHFAAALQLRAPTLLLDSDDHRSAISWSQRAEQNSRPLPFRVASYYQSARISRDYENIVIDTGQNPSKDDLEELAATSDFLIIPAVPAYLDSDGTALTIATVRSLAIHSFRVLMNRVPPPNEPDGAELRAEFQSGGIPLFAADIPRLKVFDKAATLGATVSDSSAFSRKDQPGAARAWAAYQSAIEELIPNA